MTIDLNKYRVNIPVIKAWIKQKHGQNPIDFASELAVATNVPIIVVFHYIGEIIGFSDELNDKIEKLKKFYGITKIIGKK